MKNSQKKLSIALMVALCALPKISETIYTPALPNVARGLLADASMVEATLAIYFLGYAIGFSLWGAISDFCGRRNATLMGLLFYGAATFACASATSVEALLAWRFFQAFGVSVGSVIIQTMLRDLYDGDKRTKLFSVVSAAVAFSPAIGPLLGGIICEFFGWRANFLFLAIMSLGLSLWSFFSLPETRPDDFTRISMHRIYLLFKEMFTSRQLWGHIFLISATYGVVYGFYQEAPFIFIEQLGMEPSYYGFFGLLISAATIFSARVSYQKSSHVSSEVMIQCGALCVLVGGLLFTLTVMMGIFALTTPAMLIVVSMLFLIFFGLGLIIPNSFSHALKPYQSVAGTAGSIFGGVYCCVLAGYTWIMSAFHDGTALPLPLYITMLGLVLTCSSQMIRLPNPAEQKIDS